MMKTSIKLKFRPSVISEKEGTLYYQLIHERRVKQIKTHYKIMSNEWDELSVLRPPEQVPEVPDVSREHLPQLEKIQEVLPSRGDEAHFR